MKTLCAVAVAAVASLAGCGDDGGNHHEPPVPDAFIIHDASPDARVCSTASTGMVDILGYRQFSSGAQRIQWAAPVTGLGTGSNQVEFVFEFWSDIEASLSGTFDLTAGNQGNYQTCAICLLAYELDSQGQVARTFFQSGGSITLSEDPFTNQRMVASISNLEMQEVDIAQDASSTPVAGGACATVPSFMVDHDRVPNAWTCAHTDFDTGTTCNCMCGTPDPDCNSDSATVAGCTAGQACFADACVTPPLNDTCATAIPLTIGTAVMGSTAGAKRDYDMGLEGMTCTGFQQPGPDVVYSVVLTAGTQYTVTLSGLAASYDGAVALVGPGAATVCDSPITTCVAGADDAFDGGTETFMYTPTTNGTYFIIVDAYAVDVGGSFTINVTQ